MYIDAHSHIGRYMESEYLHLREGVLKMLHEKGIFSVAASTSLEQYNQSLELAKKSRNILPTFGMFANYDDFNPEIHIPIMENSPILSEIGLTSMNMDPPPDLSKMEELFRVFLEHAEKTKKVVICHTSSEDEMALNILENYSLSGVVIHGFRASNELLQKIIDKGYLVSAGFLITDAFKDSDNWEHWRSIVKEVPMDLLLTETDGPSIRFGLNPESIIQVVETVAQLKKVSHQEIKETVFTNFRKLIGRDIGLCKYSELLSRS